MPSAEPAELTPALKPTDSFLANRWDDCNPRHAQPPVQMAPHSREIEVPAASADQAAVWGVKAPLLFPIVSGAKMALPERKSNEHNAIRVLGGRLHLDSPRNQHGVVVKAKQTEGWLHIEVDADDSIKGWALSYNGRDVPIYVDQFGNENLSDEQVDQIMSRDDDQPESS